MKKGVIVSKDNGKAVAMTESGDFVDVPDKDDLEIGETVRITPKKILIAAFAAALFLFANLCGWSVYGGIRSYSAPVTYLAVDINPSVEFALNRSKKVVSVKGNNDEGKLLVAGVDLIGKTAETAASTVVRLAAEVGYFSLAEPQEASPVNAVMLTVANDNESQTQAVTEIVTQAVDDYFDSVGIYSLILTYNLNPEFLNPDMQLCGVDLGKLQLAKLVTACGVPFDEAKDMPVRKLNEILMEHYGDTQKLLDEDVARYSDMREKLRKEHLPKISENYKSLDKQTFLLQKENFWAEKSENMYEICAKWTQYKLEWENITFAASLSAAG